MQYLVSAAYTMAGARSLQPQVRRINTFKQLYPYSRKCSWYGELWQLPRYVYG
jgi:hypothetical protein